MLENLEQQKHGYVFFSWGNNRKSWRKEQFWSVFINIFRNSNVILTPGSWSSNSNEDKSIWIWLRIRNPGSLT